MVASFSFASTDKTNMAQRLIYLNKTEMVTERSNFVPQRAKKTINDDDDDDNTVFI